MHFFLFLILHLRSSFSSYHVEDSQTQQDQNQPVDMSMDAMKKKYSVNIEEPLDLSMNTMKAIQPTNAMDVPETTVHAEIPKTKCQNSNKDNMHSEHLVNTGNIVYPINSLDPIDPRNTTKRTYTSHNKKTATKNRNNTTEEFSLLQCDSVLNTETGDEIMDESEEELNNVIEESSIPKKKQKIDNKYETNVPDETNTVEIPKEFREIILDALKTKTQDIEINIYSSLLDNKEINGNNFIDAFSNFFCINHSSQDLPIFNIKKDFILLQLIVPELLPFIYFINKLRKDLNFPIYDIKLKGKILVFDEQLNSWLSKYYKVLNSNITSKYYRRYTVLLETLLMGLEQDKKKLFLDFKKILVDFMEIIIFDNIIIKRYKSLTTIYENIIHYNMFYFKFEQIFFFYFIINSGNMHQEYMDCLTDLDDIKYGKNISEPKINSIARKIYKCLNSNIVESSIIQYNKLLKSMNMQDFDITYYIPGFLGFENGEWKILHFCFGSKDKNGQYTERIYYSELWTLLYFNFQQRVLEG